MGCLGYAGIGWQLNGVGLRVAADSIGLNCVGSWNRCEHLLNWAALEAEYEVKAGTGGAMMSFRGCQA